MYTEPSGARTRSSGSEKSFASTTTCGWRFKGDIVFVGIAVGDSVGTDVNVTVRVGVGVSTTTGKDWVGRSGVDGIFAHAPRPMKYRINIPGNRRLRHTLEDTLSFIVQLPLVA
jgi:hypothetical protein